MSGRVATKLGRTMPVSLEQTGEAVCGGRSFEATVSRRVSCEGTGLHSGQPVRLTIAPASPGCGILFHRIDLGATIRARFDLVAETHLCTQLASDSDPSVRVGTIEHVMAALAASGIDNAVLEIDGPEIPIMDGSAQHFMTMIGRAGITSQTLARRAVIVRRTVRVTDGASYAELSPGPGFSLDLSIDFEAIVIGRQSLRLDRIDGLRFGAELADCRTFAMASDIERLRQAGLARGGSLDNAIVVEDDRILNEGGLRRPDEFVRHKMLDAIGDLALAGHPIQGRFTGRRSGHGLNNRVLRALFANRANWTLVDLAHNAPATESRAA